MERCPKCGWKIEFGVTCYNCIGREQDAKRYGGKAISSTWRQKYGRKPQIYSHKNDSINVKPTLAKRIKPKPFKKVVAPSKIANKYEIKVDRHLQRKGINRFLHDIYQKEYYLSDMLNDHGFTNNQIDILKRKKLYSFIDETVVNWLVLLKGHLSQQSVDIIRFHYKLEGRIRIHEKSNYRSDKYVEKRLRESLKLLRSSSIKKKLSNKTAFVAKKLLKLEKF